MNLNSKFAGYSIACQFNTGELVPLDQLEP